MFTYFSMWVLNTANLCVTVQVDGVNLSWNSILVQQFPLLARPRPSVFGQAVQSHLVSSFDSSTSYFFYSGHTLGVLDKFVVMVSIKNRSAELELIVVSGDGPTSLTFTLSDSKQKGYTHCLIRKCTVSCCIEITQDDNEIR